MQRAGDAHAIAADPLIERLTRNVFHDYEVNAAVGGDVVDGDDIRMVQSRGCSRLLDETALTLGVGDLGWRQDLDRNHTVEPRVLGLVHLAHSTGSYGSKDLVGAEPVPREERHMR